MLFWIYIGIRYYNIVIIPDKWIKLISREYFDLLLSIKFTKSETRAVDWSIGIRILFNLIFLVQYFVILDRYKSILSKNLIFAQLIFAFLVSAVIYVVERYFITYFKLYTMFLLPTFILALLVLMLIVSIFRIKNKLKN